MSVVRFHVPENRLAKLLRIPAGGKPIADAIVEADAGLATLSGEARRQLAEALAGAEAATAKLPATYDEAALEELYALAAGAVGMASLCGRPAIDKVLQSLCDLLDHLTARRLWDVEAVKVHVRANRLLLQADAKAAAAVLEGLQQVSRRYAAPQS